MQKSNDLNELQIYLKKKIPLNFIATSTQKQLHEIKLRKKKIKNFFANAVKKKSQKKVTHTNETHTINLL
jgi:hypothetical protein